MITGPDWNRRHGIVSALSRPSCRAAGGLRRPPESRSFPTSKLTIYLDDASSFEPSQRSSDIDYSVMRGHRAKQHRAEAAPGPDGDDNGPGSEPPPHGRFRYVSTFFTSRRRPPAAVGKPSFAYFPVDYLLHDVWRPDEPTDFRERYLLDATPYERSEDNGITLRNPRNDAIHLAKLKNLESADAAKSPQTQMREFADAGAEAEAERRRRSADRTTLSITRGRVIRFCRPPVGPASPTMSIEAIAGASSVQRNVAVGFRAGVVDSGVIDTITVGEHVRLALDFKSVVRSFIKSGITCKDARLLAAYRITSFRKCLMPHEFFGLRDLAVQFSQVESDCPIEWAEMESTCRKTPGTKVASFILHKLVTDWAGQWCAQRTRTRTGSLAVGGGRPGCVFVFFALPRGPRCSLGALGLVVHLSSCAAVPLILPVFYVRAVEWRTCRNDVDCAVREYARSVEEMEEESSSSSSSSGSSSGSSRPAQKKQPVKFIRPKKTNGESRGRRYLGDDDDDDSDDDEVEVIDSKPAKPTRDALRDSSNKARSRNGSCGRPPHLSPKP
ncbi:hypothetical protein THAOC_12624 [Thalassiosira oceanica]|uniref:Uncharacterized protein n=1 Tax=Thalassiosira oceanica TaxID=159749 RepID=K0SN86_THAOC|nr:hypothetical protein THAOC_12624 [Thalassiosira oceanica]|eukprot:EJK66459.1 hypothetical protein THAOC_12624 [Thalassiosira oceanica]